MKIVITRLRHMRHAITRTHLCTRLIHWRRAKKACLVGLRKFQGMRHVTRLKQQGFLSFTSCKKQKSYEKIMCIYLFYWFSGETCIIRSGGVLYKKMFLKFANSTGKHLCRSLFFNKFVGAAVIFTYPLNLKIFEHSLKKVNEIF